jgi:large subunit ribosomal protein L15
VKLHDLKPAPGSRRPRRRVGRGIAAGQGKTAGRGTKGQKARAGGTIPAWFEGGQTPLHQRIPKLRGFTNLFKIQYEVVNIGDIARLVELGALEGGEMPGAKPSKKSGAAPITVNQEILRAAGLVRRLDRPMKVLGGGELSTALFVVADAFSASARSKIEGAGGTVSVLETPQVKRPALRVEATPATEAAPAPAREAAAAESDTEPATEVVATVDAPATADATSDADAAEASTDTAEAPADEATAAAPKRGAKARRAAVEPADDEEPREPRARTPRKPRATKSDTDA